MASTADHGYTRAIRKKDSHGLTINELRARVEDAARAANLTTGRSISVSGGTRRAEGKVLYDGGQKPGRGL